MPPATCSSPTAATPRSLTSGMRNAECGMWNTRAAARIRRRGTGVRFGVSRRQALMATFLFKLLVSPLLIGAVSLAGRRWGPAVSGWLVGLPLTSGPVVLFLALEQGTTFAAAAAQAIMLGIISVGVFCLTY